MATASVTGNLITLLSCEMSERYTAFAFYEFRLKRLRWEHVKNI